MNLNFKPTMELLMFKNLLSSVRVKVFSSTAVRRLLSSGPLLVNFEVYEAVLSKFKMCFGWENIYFVFYFSTYSHIILVFVFNPSVSGANISLIFKAFWNLNCLLKIIAFFSLSFFLMVMSLSVAPAEMIKKMAAHELCGLSVYSSLYLMHPN